MRLSRRVLSAIILLCAACVCTFTCSSRFAPNINLAFDLTDSFGVKVSNVPLELEALAILVQNFSNWTVLTDSAVGDLTATGAREREFEDVLEAISPEYDVDIDIDGAARTVTFE